jgi:hypothetical protein
VEVVEITPDPEFGQIEIRRTVVGPQLGAAFKSLAGCDLQVGEIDEHGRLA